MTALVSIPTSSVGSVSVPQLFLGDHGYLAKLDSAMTVDQVKESMRGMLSTASVGISAGESRVIDAALQALDGRGGERLMIHADIPAHLRNERIRYRHLAATTVERLASFGLNCAEDRVLGFLYEVGAQGMPIPLKHAGHLRLDEGALQSWERDIRRAKPSMVSVGGDWLDLLLLTGREDLAFDGITRIAGVARSIGAAVLATTYVGAIVPAAILPIVQSVDGLLVTLNSFGFGMLPTGPAHLSWLRDVSKPVVGMHVLAGGSTPDSALNWLDVAHVVALVIGASSESHQQVLAAAASRHFLGADR